MTGPSDRTGFLSAALCATVANLPTHALDSVFEAASVDPGPGIAYSELRAISVVVYGFQIHKN
jgi:hypothetical protein